MSTESSKTLLRQWHIVRYLLNGAYVSTANVCEHLAGVGIDAEIRTVQRDLRTLEKIFPLECREDSVPHSWRWKRPAEMPSAGLKMDQALTLRLVEEQLQDVLPPQVREELQPLFLRARLVTAGEGAALPELVATPRSLTVGSVMSFTQDSLPSLWLRVMNPVRALLKLEERTSLVAALNELREILLIQDMEELTQSLEL